MSEESLKAELDWHIDEIAAQDKEIKQLREENVRLKAELAECKREIDRLQSELAENDPCRGMDEIAMSKGGEG